MSRKTKQATTPDLPLLQVGNFQLMGGWGSNDGCKRIVPPPISTRPTTQLSFHPQVDEFAPLLHVHPPTDPLSLLTPDERTELVGLYNHLHRLVIVAEYCRTYLPAFTDLSTQANRAEQAVRNCISDITTKADQLLKDATTHD